MSYVAKCFIDLKSYSDNLPALKSQIDLILISALEDYKTIMKGKRLNLASLSVELDKDEVGVSIVSSFEIFKGENIKALNEKTNKHGIDFLFICFK